ncbi:MAG: hypothetical protein JWN70_4964 [Planctomycetaceae bacterium]|nr:hypothetical protein [Planctomycetaceae bacterium]
MSHSFDPLFSAGFSELMALIFVMVSVIGWIIKQAQGNNQQLPPPVQRPGKRREERNADELDSFLQQVNRQPEQRQPNQSGRGNPNRSRPPGSSGQSAASQRPAAKTVQRQQPATPAQPPRRLVEDSASRREAAAQGASGSGGVAQHVREHMSERIGDEAKRDVGQGIKDSVLHNMGTGLLAPVETGTSVRKTATQLFAKEPASAAECCSAIRMESLRKMLGNPESIRQAIVIQEILNRPKCLR